MLISQIFRVAWFTIFQAACSTCVALIFGLPGAFFISQRIFLGRKLLSSLSVVPFCMPSLLIALGYVTFLGLNGGLNRFLMLVFDLKEPPLKFLYSFFGLIIAQGCYNFPLIMKQVGDSWRQLPKQQQECARLLGSSEFRIFRTVTLPQLIPSIASSSLICFIYCFLSFILILLFGGIGNTTLEVEIYKTARASLDLKKAFALGLIETLILLVITFFYCIFQQKNSRSKGIKNLKLTKLSNLHGFSEISLFSVYILLLTIFFILPMLGIVYNAFTSTNVALQKNSGFTFQTFMSIFKLKSFLPSLKSTILTSFCTGTCSTIIAFLYSTFLLFNFRKGSNALKTIFTTLPILPMTTSSVITGILLTAIFPKGSFSLLIFAQTMLFWPIAFQQIHPNISKISNKTLDSAILLSKNRFDIIIRFVLPSVKISLLRAFCFTFSISAGDTTLPLVLAIPKYNSLSLFTYRLAGAYRFNQACAAGIILALICLSVFAIGTLLNQSTFKRKR